MDSVVGIRCRRVVDHISVGDWSSQLREILAYPRQCGSQERIHHAAYLQVDHGCSSFLGTADGTLRGLLTWSCVS